MTEKQEIEKMKTKQYLKEDIEEKEKYINELNGKIAYHKQIIKNTEFEIRMLKIILNNNIKELEELKEELIKCEQRKIQN